MDRDAALRAAAETLALATFTFLSRCCQAAADYSRQLQQIQAIYGPLPVDLGSLASLAVATAPPAPGQTLHEAPAAGHDAPTGRPDPSHVPAQPSEADQARQEQQPQQEAADPVASPRRHLQLLEQVQTSLHRAHTGSAFAPAPNRPLDPQQQQRQQQPVIPTSRRSGEAAGSGSTSGQGQHAGSPPKVPPPLFTPAPLQHTRPTAGAGAPLGGPGSATGSPTEAASAKGSVAQQAAAALTEQPGPGLQREQRSAPVGGGQAPLRTLSDPSPLPAVRGSDLFPEAAAPPPRQLSPISLQPSPQHPAPWQAHQQQQQQSGEAGGGLQEAHAQSGQPDRPLERQEQHHRPQQQQQQQQQQAGGDAGLGSAMGAQPELLHTDSNLQDQSRAQLGPLLRFLSSFSESVVGAGSQPRSPSEPRGGTPTAQRAEGPAGGAPTAGAAGAAAAAAASHAAAGLSLGLPGPAPFGSGFGQAETGGAVEQQGLRQQAGRPSVLPQQQQQQEQVQQEPQQGVPGSLPGAMQQQWQYPHQSELLEQQLLLRMLSQLSSQTGPAPPTDNLGQAQMPGGAASAGGPAAAAGGASHGGKRRKGSADAPAVGEQPVMMITPDQAPVGRSQAAPASHPAHLAAQAAPDPSQQAQQQQQQQAWLGLVATKPAPLTAMQQLAQAAALGAAAGVLPAAGAYLLSQHAAPALAMPAATQPVPPAAAASLLSLPLSPGPAAASILATTYPPIPTRPAPAEAVQRAKRQRVVHVEGDPAGLAAPPTAAASYGAAAAAGAAGAGAAGVEAGRTMVPPPDIQAPKLEHVVTRDTSRLGSWGEEDKQELIRLVQLHKPVGATEWEVIADKLGRWSRGGASAERMYRTLTDPGYQKATNKHGRRLNPRRRIAMHVMACFALRALPGHEGNLSQIATLIKGHPEFSKELDWSPRPGTKTYPRWKDALVGCFKRGRYPYLIKTSKKEEGLSVYRLDTALLTPAVDQELAKYAASQSAADVGLAAAQVAPGGDGGLEEAVDEEGALSDADEDAAAARSATPEAGGTPLPPPAG